LLVLLVIASSSIVHKPGLVFFVFKTKFRLFFCLSGTRIFAYVWSIGGSFCFRGLYSVESLRFASSLPFYFTFMEEGTRFYSILELYLVLSYYWEGFCDELMMVGLVSTYIQMNGWGE